jgi:hypothetical protein
MLFTQNYSPRNTLVQIPFQILYGKDIPITHLGRFGCVEYLWLAPKQRENKLAPASKPAIMMGYAEGSKTIYRVLDIDSGRMLTTSNTPFRGGLDGFTTFCSKCSSDAARLYAPLQPIYEEDEFTVPRMAKTHR